MTLKELANKLNTSKKTLKQLCVFKDEQNISFEEELNARKSWAKRKNQKQIPIKNRTLLNQNISDLIYTSKKTNKARKKLYNNRDYKEAKTLEAVMVLYCNGFTNKQIAREMSTNKKYKDIANLSVSEINQILVSHGHRANKIIDKKHSWNKTVS